MALNDVHKRKRTFKRCIQRFLESFLNLRRVTAEILSKRVFIGQQAACATNKEW